MAQTLLLQLAGPMQSWGHRSRFDNRDTGLEPTRSGVIGLLCCALGWDRGADLRVFDDLKMGVRVENPGRVSLDFHTAQRRGEANASLSNRYYLSDAHFLVGLEGEPDLLRKLEAALHDPKWALFLGRKSFPASLPLGRGIVEGDVKTALESAPWQGLSRGEKRRFADEPPRKLIWETSDPRAGEAITDSPRDFERRRYAVRYLRFGQTAPPRWIVGPEAERSEVQL